MAKEVHACPNLKGIMALTKNAHVPECSEGLDRPLNEMDFAEYKQTVALKLQEIINILNGECKNPHHDAQKLMNDNKLAVVHLLILCGEYSAKDHWTTSSSIKILAEIRKKLLIFLWKSSVEELLSDNMTLFKSTLIVLRPKLLSNTWKCNPAAVTSYCWLLAQVKSPFLNDFLNDVLPTALIITDDFESPNKVKGLKCIHHIIDNVTKADLEMFGQNEVILDELLTIFYHHELDFLEPLLACTVALLRKMNPIIPYSNLERSKFDDIFDIILFNAEMEEKKNVKIMYLSYLPDMITAFRLRTFRHLRKLLMLIVTEIEIESDIDFIKLLLNIFDTTVKCCWPRCCNFEKCRPVILALLKWLHNHSMKTDNCTNIDNDELILCVKSTFLLLKQFCTIEMEQLGLDIVNNEELENKFKMLTDSLLIT